MNFYKKLFLTTIAAINFTHSMESTDTSTKIVKTQQKKDVKLVQADNTPFFLLSTVLSLKSIGSEYDMVRIAPIELKNNQDIFNKNYSNQYDSDETKEITNIIKDSNSTQEKSTLYMIYLAHKTIDIIENKLKAANIDTDTLYAVLFTTTDKDGCSTLTAKIIDIREQAILMCQSLELIFFGDYVPIASLNSSLDIGEKALSMMHKIHLSTLSMTVMEDAKSYYANRVIRSELNTIEYMINSKQINADKVLIIDYETIHSLALNNLLNQNISTLTSQEIKKILAHNYLTDAKKKIHKIQEFIQNKAYPEGVQKGYALVVNVLFENSQVKNAYIFSIYRIEESKILSNQTNNICKSSKHTNIFEKEINTKEIMFAIENDEDQTSDEEDFTLLLEQAKNAQDQSQKRKNKKARKKAIKAETKRNQN